MWLYDYDDDDEFIQSIHDQSYLYSNWLNEMANRKKICSTYNRSQARLSYILKLSVWLNRTLCHVFLHVYRNRNHPMLSTCICSRTKAATIKYLCKYPTLYSHWAGCFREGFISSAVIVLAYQRGIVMMTVVYTW